MWWSRTCSALTEEQPARAPTNGASARERWSYREDLQGAADWGCRRLGPKLQDHLPGSPGTQGPTELHIEGPVSLSHSLMWPCGLEHRSASLIAVSLQSMPGLSHPSTPTPDSPSPLQRDHLP